MDLFVNYMDFIFPFIPSSKAHENHLESLASQLLVKEGLSIKWADTVLSMARRASQLVRPDVKNDNDLMDILQYVQVKKVSEIQYSSTLYVVLFACHDS